MSFGQYDYHSSTFSTGTVSVTCASTIVFAIELSEGNGTFLDRQMRSAENSVLSYNLFTGPDYTQIWGGQTGPGTVTMGGTGTGQLQTYSVFGQIPAGQQPGPGQYNDTIIVTIAW